MVRVMVGVDGAAKGRVQIAVAVVGIDVDGEEANRQGVPRCRSFDVKKDQ